MRRTVFSSLFTLLSTCWCLAGAGAARAQFPNIARGYSPSGMFDAGGIDVVNGFNGNLGDADGLARLQLLRRVP